MLGCNQYMTAEMLPAEYRDLVREPARAESRGGSVIVSPLGEIIAGPLYGEAGVVTAELDLEDIVRARLDFDVAGHYARPDIFKFDVRDQPEQRREDREN